ncbi:MAG: 2-C-methyl-D-erythritol 4-phosphate cytidylyltransferase [Candidatus Aminicenantes bacterium]|nr:2-C-methyl-D-erythritol 4-phosphate cytidylyltransferase [Candidatus Aminicenantes bacterium]
MTGLILAAAGSGSRFGSPTPKQFLRMGGKRLYRLALDPFLPFLNEAVILVPEDWIDTVRRELSAGAAKDRDLRVAPGGRHRQDTVSRGLQLLSPGVEIVLVHDAARPYVDARLISRVIRTVRRGKAAVPVLKIRDTVKEVVSGRVEGTLERERLGLAQTPQGFPAEILNEALRQAGRDHFYGTDESSLVERIGAEVQAVEGDPRNLKVTFEGDL